MESELCKNMAPTSGALKWAKMLRERIQTPWEKIRLLLDIAMYTCYGFEEMNKWVDSQR